MNELEAGRLINGKFPGNFSPGKKRKSLKR